MRSSPVQSLLVFVKPPIPGEVKTRLAREVGPETACRLYRAWVPPLIETLLRIEETRIEICLAPPREEPDREEVLARARKWLPFPVRWSWQRGEELGERLANAFRTSLETGSKSVFAVGSDSPHLADKHLQENFNLLEEKDLVLGPAEDGGYYTVGMKRDPGDLFQNIPWSTESTLEATRKAARARGWSVGLGPESFDLDTVEDVLRLIEEDPDRWRFLKEILEGNL